MQVVYSLSRDKEVFFLPRVSRTGRYMTSGQTDEIKIGIQYSGKDYPIDVRPQTSRQTTKVVIGVFSTQTYIQDRCQLRSTTLLQPRSP